MYQRAFGIAVLVITINELIENGKTRPSGHLSGKGRLLNLKPMKILHTIQVVK